MMTEDHPLDYVDFEGVIPEGEYGARTVIVWDTGTYRRLRGEPLEEGLVAGHAPRRLRADAGRQERRPRALAAG